MAGEGSTTGNPSGFVQSEADSKGKGKAVDPTPQDVSMDEDEDEDTSDEETGDVSLQSAHLNQDIQTNLFPLPPTTASRGT